MKLLRPILELHQLIRKPTQILENSVPSIDRVFAFQPSLVVDSGVISSLHCCCHYQIVFTKFDVQMHHQPPYEREVWHYQDADANLIRRAIDEFSWERTLINLYINDQVALFSRNVSTLVLLRDGWRGDCVGWWSKGVCLYFLLSKCYLKYLTYNIIYYFFR